MKRLRGHLFFPGADSSSTDPASSTIVSNDDHFDKRQNFPEHIKLNKTNWTFGRFDDPQSTVLDLSPESVIARFAGEIAEKGEIRVLCSPKHVLLEEHNAAFGSGARSASGLSPSDLWAKGRTKGIAQKCKGIFRRGQSHRCTSGGKAETDVLKMGEVPGWEKRVRQKLFDQSKKLQAKFRSSVSAMVSATSVPNLIIRPAPNIGTER